MGDYPSHGRGGRLETYLLEHYRITQCLPKRRVVRRLYPSCLQNQQRELRHLCSDGVEARQIHSGAKHLGNTHAEFFIWNLAFVVGQVECDVEGIRIWRLVRNANSKALR